MVRNCLTEILAEIIHSCHVYSARLRLARQLTELWPVCQDRVIGHQVVTLAGAVPAANYLQLPQDKNSTLALTGAFLYFQVMLCL